MTEAVIAAPPQRLRIFLTLPAVERKPMTDLKISVDRVEPTALRTPLLVLQHFEGEPAPVGAAERVDARLGGQISRVLAAGDFSGKTDETLVLYPREGELGAQRVLLVGVGKRSDYSVDRLRQALGTAARQAQRLGVSGLGTVPAITDEAAESVGDRLAAQAAVEGVLLGAWELTELKTETEQQASRTALASLIISASDPGQAEAYRSGAAHGRVTARAENLARQLATRPGNVATPTHLAETAEAIAREHSMDITILDREAMEREGMGALLAVARGSDEEPRFIALEYRGGEGDAGPLVLVGKGVTFDSGGISIKPAAKMAEMKYDMSGAAAVLGAMQAVAELGLRAHVVGLIPATENLLSGRALKPGDVIRSHAGKTIEVMNTDAEGRLILADALSYAQRYRPQAMLDAATLTGAVVIGLGQHAIGLMGNRAELIDEVRAAGERSGERCWPLPLWDEYRRQLDSPVADLQNVGGRAAGTITAGWFLREFVGDVPWAHLDIAGTAWRDEDRPYLRKGATGVPTRLFVEWVRARADE